APTVIDEKVLSKIEELASLAPLHNPANAAGIRAAMELLPDATHVAVFDTAFHQTISRRASTYAIPQALAAENQIRRYGFHGTSHQFVAQRAADHLGEDIRNLRIITCHLGGGCSVCAVEYGRSVETSMGMTPLEGLVMGTRSGDLDPGAILQLMRFGKSVDEVDEILNRQSGLAGLSGVGNDMRDIEKRAEEGDEQCRLAIQVFCHRVRKYIGAYAAVMGGVDAIVFTAGIGENSRTVRHRVCQRLEFLGARFDEDRNRDVSLSSEAAVAEVSSANSRVRILAVATDESQAIAKLAGATAEAAKREQPEAKPIPVAVSARHVHLRQETVEALFGEGHQLTPIKELSQPGQFACEECVSLVGPKRTLERVRVLGPARSKDQIEIARTDEFFLGLDAPVRRSGDVENSPGITLLGTEGRKVTLEKGVICAWRHIHMTTKDAEAYGVENGDIVEVEVGKGGGRSLTFGDVLIRVKDSYSLEMHIDTDEGNAAELKPRSEGELEITDGQAQLRR
ncbi:MAG: acetate/propionate family kinase, partial [Planctomycetota bacterium]